MEYSLLHIASWLQTIDCTLIGNDTKRNEAEQDGTTLERGVPESRIELSNDHSTRRQYVSFY